MITTPSTPTLLGVVRQQLSTVVAPAVSDPGAGAAVAMMDLVLRTLQERSAHEIGWMIEEIREIERIADEFCASGSDSGPVAEALTELRTSDRSGFHLAEVSADYALAGEVLSRLAEQSVVLGGSVHDIAVHLLQGRLRNEEQIMGDFTLVAR